MSTNQRLFTYLEPFYGRDPLFHQLDRVMEQAIKDLLPRSTSNHMAVAVPPCDVKETGSDLTFIFDLPGVKLKDIKLDVEGHRLHLVATRETLVKSDQNGTNGTPSNSWIERHASRYERVINLPESVRADTVDADYNNGELQVRFQKHESVKKKKIEIKERSGQEQGTVDVTKETARLSDTTPA